MRRSDGAQKPVRGKGVTLGAAYADPAVGHKTTGGSGNYSVTLGYTFTGTLSRPLDAISGTLKMIRDNKTPKLIQVARNSVRLDELLAANAPLTTVYVLKTQLKELCYAPSENEARRRWGEWFTMALDSGIKPLMLFAKRLQSNLPGIVASAVFRYRQFNAGRPVVPHSWIGVKNPGAV